MDLIRTDEYLDSGEVRVGDDKSAVIIGPNGVRIMPDDATGDAEFGAESTKIPGAIVQLDVPPGKLAFDSGAKIQNPMQAVTAPTIATPYKPIITAPPAQASKLLRGITAVIMGILETYRSAKEDSQSEGVPFMVNTITGNNNMGNT